MTPLTTPSSRPFSHSTLRSAPLFLVAGLLGVSALSLTAQSSEAEVESLLQDLLGSARVQAALDYVESTDDRTLRDLIDLTEIPAPPFSEDARAEEFARRLRAAGADTVWVDEEGNVLGLRRGTGGERGAVVVSGHLDTVFPEGTDVTVRTVGDTLKAPGIADDTRGLATVLAVARALAEFELRTTRDLLLVGTVGEEGLGDLRGVKHLFREGGPEIAAFISVDGTGLDRITHMALGSLRYRVTFTGPGGHSWGAFGLANPAHALGRAIALLDARLATETAEGPRTSYNVGRIGGGTSVNSIPFSSWMEVDLRSVDPMALERIDRILRSVMSEALQAENADRLDGPALELVVEVIGDRPSGEVPEEDRLVRSAVVLTRHFGGAPTLERSSTDANYPISLGVPSITIGGGGLGGAAHSLDEWYLHRGSVAGVQRVLLLTLAQAGFTPSD